jgi:hypothetical protein
MTEETRPLTTAITDTYPLMPGGESSSFGPYYVYDEEAMRVYADETCALREALRKAQGAEVAQAHSVGIYPPLVGGERSAYGNRTVYTSDDVRAYVDMTCALRAAALRQ